MTNEIKNFNLNSVNTSDKLIDKHIEFIQCSSYPLSVTILISRNINKVEIVDIDNRVY